MISSMTGYGAAETALPDGRALRVEIRTLNHRHLTVSASLPRSWERLRPKIAARVRAALARGSVAVSASAEAPDARLAPQPTLDIEAARRYAALLDEARTELDLAGRLDINTLAVLPGVLAEPEDADVGAEPPDEAALTACLDEALAAVAEMRRAEGRRLEEVLRGSVARILAHVNAAEARAPRRLLRERDRLRARVAELAGAAGVDEDRLAREIAHLAEKWDVAEELQRLRSHASAFLDGLGGTGRAGKRLGFLVQEMAREANTLGAKANDAAMSASAVAVKEELERLREQLENVE